MMILAKDAIELVFSAALFINALLFIPQILRLLREKSAKGVSLLTFLGLLLIQFTIVLHGIITHDHLLVVGYMASMLTCGSVVVLVFLYNKHKSADHDLSGYDILNQLPCHIYWKDREGVFLGCNSSNWKDFNLRSLADYKGKTDYDILSEDEAYKIRMVDDRELKSGNIEVVEEEVTSTHG